MPIVWLVILLIRVFSSSATTVTGSSTAPVGFTGVVRFMIGFAWGVLSLFAIGQLVHVIDTPSIATMGLFGAETATLAGLGAWLFFPWPILRKLSRDSNPKLVYWLTRFSFVFAFTGETRAAAILLAALTAAHQGIAPKDLRHWLWSLLKSEDSDLGTFGAAFGLLEALEAGAARKKNKLEKAHFHAERSRWLLGTVTYMSPRGVPAPVLALVYELLDLDSAERGMWGGIDTPDANLTELTRAMRDWTKVHLEPNGDKKAADKSRAHAASPLLESLYARPRDVPNPPDAKHARSRACFDYLALSRGEPIGVRASLNLLITFDMLLHPGSPDTLLSPEIAGDEETMNAVHDDVAEELARALYRSPGVPIFALASPGPISSRVYAKLEVLLLADLEREFAAMIEGNKAHPQGFGRVLARGDALAEWLDASRVRGLYRRVQFSLGDPAAQQVWPRLMFAYCNYGVKLSEHWPRRRPLAHAVFNCLYGEALRFQDLDRVNLLGKNKSVTAGST
jgi:hypothetical protein